MPETVFVKSPTGLSTADFELLVVRRTCRSINESVTSLVESTVKQSADQQSSGCAEDDERIHMLIKLKLLNFAMSVVRAVDSVESSAWQKAVAQSSSSSTD